MDRETAKSIIDITFKMGKQFDVILLLINRGIDDADTKKKYEIIVQDLIGHICIDLVMPIVDIYPDLNPAT